VEYLKDGTTQVIQAAKLIMALNMEQCLEVVSDLDATERAIFSRLSSKVLCTTLYEADLAQCHEHAVEWWPARMQDDKGRAYGHRNSALALQVCSVFMYWFGVGQIEVVSSSSHLCNGFAET
jgi:hypothetical protein